MTFNFFKRKRIRPVRPVESQLPWTSIYLDKWKNDPDRVEFARQLFRNPLFIDMLSTAKNTLVTRPPARRQIQSGSAVEIEECSAELQLGRALGIQDFLTLLETLRYDPEPDVNYQLEQTYEREEREEREPIKK